MNTDKPIESGAFWIRNVIDDFYPQRIDIFSCITQCLTTVLIPEGVPSNAAVVHSDGKSASRAGINVDAKLFLLRQFHCLKNVSLT